jgi:hypothetical protein
MPAELAAGLPMEEHKIDSMVTIETPYDNAAEKHLPWTEIRRLRTTLAWSGTMPALIDSLTILSPTNVVARRNTTSSIHEYRLTKQVNGWVIEGVTRQQVHRYSSDRP